VQVRQLLLAQQAARMTVVGQAPVLVQQRAVLPAS